MVEPNSSIASLPFHLVGDSVGNSRPSSDSGSHAPTPTYRPTVIASKSEPSIQMGQERAQSDPSIQHRPLSRQQSEPTVLRQSAVSDPLRALSLSYLGRGWSVLNQARTPGNTLGKDYLRKIYKFEKPSDLCFINISGKRLLHIDKKTLKPFTNVIYVDAGDNNLPFEYFSCFENLKELIIPLNNLSYFSVQVPLFHHLQILDASFNQILPSSIYGLCLLPVLHWLNLSSNDLDRLPTNMSSKSFPLLEVLILDDNHLGRPNDFLSLCRLPKLRMLSMDRNGVTSLPVIDTLKTEKRNEITVLAMLPQAEDVFTFPTRPQTDTSRIRRHVRTGRSGSTMDKCTETYEWRCPRQKSTKSATRRRKAKPLASRLLLRHLDRAHSNQGTWPLPTELLNALMSGIQIPPRHNVILYDPNIKCPTKHPLPPIESELSQLMIGEDVSEVLDKSESTQEETSESSPLTSHVSTSTLASALVNEVMERISHVSSEKTTSTPTESVLSKSRSSGKPGTQYEPAGEIPAGVQSEETNSTSMQETTVMSDSMDESQSLNVLPSVTKSSVCKSFLTATSEISSFQSESLPSGKLSKSPVGSTKSITKSERSVKSDKSIKSVEITSAPPVTSRDKSILTDLTGVFRRLPDVLPPARAYTSYTAQPSTSEVCKPVFLYDSNNLSAPFPMLQQLSLAGNKIQCVEDILAVKTWHKVIELSVKGNPVLSLPRTKLSLMKQQLVPEIKKKLVTYKLCDRGIDPFYKQHLVSKLNPVEVRQCPCHQTSSKMMAPTHRFFNLDVSQPTPPGVLSLPIPSLRICRYLKTVDDSLATYREVFRQVTSDPSLSFDTIPLVPFRLRAILFPFHHYHDHLDVTAATSLDSSDHRHAMLAIASVVKAYAAFGIDNVYELKQNLETKRKHKIRLTLSDKLFADYEWPLTKSNTLSCQNCRLCAGGAVRAIVRDSLLEHLESYVHQISAKHDKVETSTVSSGLTMLNKKISEVLRKNEAKH